MKTASWNPPHVCTLFMLWTVKIVLCHGLLLMDGYNNELWCLYIHDKEEEAAETIKIITGSVELICYSRFSLTTMFVVMKVISIRMEV